MKIVSALLACLFCSNAHAKIVTKTIEYKDRDAVLEGFVTYDDARSGKLPGVLVVHDWVGISDYMHLRAEMLAKLGYVAFAADIYGKGVRPKPGKEASAVATKFKNDRELMRARVIAGLEALKAQSKVDPKRIAAIGYCFGGTTVLELARAGADIKGVASFHGGLSSVTPADASTLKAKVVVYHGAEDPNVPEAEVKAFEDEMRKAKADWSLTKYANAVHAFTVPSLVGANAMKGSAEYNESADKRSWASLQNYFKEWFL